VAKDDAKAAEWCAKAAEKGYDRAQYNLGLHYKKGRGIPRDYAKAVLWLTKAVEQGHTDAQYELGCCYGAGLGVPRDYEKALEWCMKAAERDFDYRKLLKCAWCETYTSVGVERGLFGKKKIACKTCGKTFSPKKLGWTP